MKRKFLEVLSRLFAPTVRYDIFMAGDPDAARRVCRAYCDEFGLCVHFHEVDYIFTGGEEIGFKVGLINYPRFPSTDAKLREHSAALGERLMASLGQGSWSMVGPDETTWHTRRPGDLPLPEAA